MTRYRRSVLLTRVAVLVAVLAFLEVAPRAGWVDSLTLVPLSEMLSALVTQVGTGETLRNIWFTGLMIVLSFLLAAVTGVVAGHLVWRYRWLRRAINPYLTSYYALPVFAFYPVLVAIFGLNRIPVVLIAWVYATVVVITNTVIGLDGVKDVYLKTARVYGLGRWESLRLIQLPAAAGHVFTGLRLAVTYSVIGVIASEFILATQGLGYLVSFHYNNFRLADMYAAILLVITVAVLMTGSVSLLERRFRAPREEP